MKKIKKQTALKWARQVLETEIEGISNLKKRLNHDFLKAVDMDPDNAKYYYSDLAVGSYINAQEGIKAGTYDEKDVIRRSLFYSLSALGFDPQRVQQILYG